MPWIRDSSAMKTVIFCCFFGGKDMYSCVFVAYNQGALCCCALGNVTECVAVMCFALRRSHNLQQYQYFFATTFDRIDKQPKTHIGKRHQLTQLRTHTTFQCVRLCVFAYVFFVLLKGIVRQTTFDKQPKTHIRTKITIAHTQLSDVCVFVLLHIFS